MVGISPLILASYYCDLRLQQFLNFHQIKFNFRVLSFNFFIVIIIKRRHSLTGSLV